MPDIRVSRHNGWLSIDGNRVGDLDISETVVIDVEMTDTLGALVRAAGQLWTERGPFQPAVLVVSRGPHHHWLVAYDPIVQPDGSLCWGTPWTQLSLLDLQRLYPVGLAIDPQKDQLVLAELPPIGQGFDLDWALIVSIYNDVLPYMEDLLVLAGVAGLGQRAAKSAAQRVRHGLSVVRKAVPRWESRGGHPYEVREVLVDSVRSDSEKARLLGLDDAAEVEAARTLLTPDDALMRVIQAMPSVDERTAHALRRVRRLQEAPKPQRIPCDCKYSCGRVGAVVPMAYGLKIGLDAPSDHFVVGDAYLDLLLDEAQRAKNMGW